MISVPRVTDDHDIAMLRREERDTALFCVIADAVSQFLVPFDELTILVVQAAIAMALKRFQGQLPEGMIAIVAGRQIAAERKQRLEAKSGRKA